MIRFMTSTPTNHTMHTAPRMALPRRTNRVGKRRRYRKIAASLMIVEESAYKMKHADTVYATQ